MLYFAMVFSVFSFAQNTTSTIFGTTTDGNETLPGAIVKLTEVESGTTYTVISNHKGAYA